MSLRRSGCRNRSGLPIESLEVRRLLSAQVVSVPGPSGFSPTPGNVISDGTHGYYYHYGGNYIAPIYRTDGTAAGTQSLGEVPFGDAGGADAPQQFTLASGRLFFLAAETESYALELYSVDSSDHVAKLSNFVPSGGYLPAHDLVEYRGTAYVVGWSS